MSTTSASAGPTAGRPRGKSAGREPLIEYRTEDPLLPLSMLADRVRGSAFGATALLAGAIFASNVLIIYYLQQVRGYNALESGLAFLPTTLAVLIFATVGGRLVLKLGPRVVIATGAASGVAGFLILASASSATGLAVLLPAMALVGAAVGLSWPALRTTTIPDGDAVAVIGHIEAVAASGRDYANNFVFVVTLRDDLIAQVDEYIDTQHANDVLFSN